MAVRKLEDSMLMDPLLEDKFLRACLQYPKLVTMSSDRLSADSFSTTIKGNLYHTLAIYYDTFGTESPAGHDELVITLGELLPENGVTLVKKYLKKVADIPVPEWSWIIHHANNFVRKISLGAAMQKADRLLKSDKGEEAQEELLTTIRRSGITGGGMQNMLDVDAEYLESLGREENYKCCDTRIYPLDHELGGLYRKAALMVLAPLNVGKSWAMIQFAVSALLEGKRVLYNTFEMPEDRVMGRILQNICGAASTSEALQANVERWNPDFTEKEAAVVPTILDSKVTKRGLEHLKRFGGELVIREYASGTPTMRDVERDIGLFDATFSANPDLIIIDGLSDIRLTSNDPFKELGNIVKDMRRIAKEYHAAVVFTHQANRKSMEADVVEAHHTAESLPVIQVADVAVALMQTTEEHEKGEMRLKVVRSRNSKKNAYMRLYQNYSIGQFCQHAEFIELPKGKGQ